MALFKNIGKKIKDLALAMFIVGLIASIIIAFLLIAADDNNSPIALCLLIIGPFLSLISAWVLYGFGELIDKTTEIARNTNLTNYETVDNQPKLKVDPRQEKLQHLLDQRLITEQEYSQLLQNKEA